MSISKAEQETIITFDEKQKTANVFTYSKKFINLLNNLPPERKTDIKINYKNNDGSVEFEIPKKWVKISPSRIITEEQRQRYAERLLLNKKS